MVGIEAIMTSPFPSTVLLLPQPSLAHSNQPKAITTTEGYHMVITTTKRNAKIAGGKFEITLEGQE
jgi:hypothetical protein